MAGLLDGRASRPSPRRSAHLDTSRTSAASAAAPVAAAASTCKTVERTASFADPAAFNKKVKVLFLGIGSEEGPGTKTFSDQLTQAGVHNVYFESPARHTSG
jgi:hypothetical protein